MQLLSLTLKGFRGIRDGLGLETLTLDFEALCDGAQLVAITGANGRGKSTVLDNMHPFMTMPSRVATAGAGGFSYYDHVYLPESEKDLTWALEGRCYRTQVVIRLNGRRRTEAYLSTLADDGVWRLADVLRQRHHDARRERQPPDLAIRRRRLSRRRMDAALAHLAEFYDETGRGFELRYVGGGWRYWTRAEHAELIGGWLIEGQHAKLSQAALETLAVVAYLQPISRSRVSAVRGVNVDGVLRTHPEVGEYNQKI